MTFHYEFKHPELLTQALTHSSFHNENPHKSKGHNERLEFLGDAVIDLVLSEKLFLDFPKYREGEMSKIRASLVNENALYELAQSHGLNENMLLGKGEEASGGRTKSRLVASVYEAYVGALFLDGGFEVAKDFVNTQFESLIANIDHEVHFRGDFKTRFQESIQERRAEPPVYTLIKEEGPDHDKLFYVDISVKGQILATGQGRTKKQAEQDAARRALESDAEAQA